MRDAVLVFLMLGLAVVPAAAGEAISGPARVIDGDTIEVGGKRIELYGIDAPEPEQTCEKGGKWYRCGAAATEALRAQIAEPVRCVPAKGSTPDRIVAKCIAGFVELNAFMVTRGFAVAGVKHAKDYVAKEAKARRALRGVWHGRFDYPWDWRKRHGK